MPPIGNRDHQAIGFDLQVGLFPFRRELQLEFGQFLVDARWGNQMVVGEDQARGRNDRATARGIPDELLLAIDRAAHDDRELHRGVNCMS